MRRLCEALILGIQLLVLKAPQIETKSSDGRAFSTTYKRTEKSSEASKRRDGLFKEKPKGKKNANFDRTHPFYRLPALGKVCLAEYASSSQMGSFFFFGWSPLVRRWTMA